MIDFLQISELKFFDRRKSNQCCSHKQYIYDKEVENQNILAHHINAMHCQMNKYKINKHRGNAV